ncbi:hypothetical protein [Faecalibacterium sp. AM43-5AT]|uniref:hypothetical protein n=1 Tax=Faecalibacterium sp. AM43-5AT TaxID=2302957 RepID=UPI000E741675|nr:hypothetical protein [Faecalibacterium sp. AM43-5AT]RJV98697.1 hypothetical protein DW937_03025 [Faecalibacterium sp. AM43-5AT]
MSLEIWSFLVDVSSLIVTTVLTIKIYRLERSHEKEREQMEVEARKKAVVEAARVFLIDNEDEIEYLPLSVIAKSLNLKRKHHRAITTKFLRCSEEVQKEILKQVNFQPIEVSKEQVSTVLKLLRDDIKTYCFGRDVLYDGAKYFHRAMERYSDKEIETVNPYIFEDIKRTHFYQGDSLKLLKDTSYNGTLYGYMHDYIHSADLGKSKWLLQPPIDMVLSQCDLAGCPEDIMTFWMMRIVIDCCRVFAESEEDFIFDEDLIKTQEDMYYYAVMVLYNTYIAKKVEDADE